jgi:hypothetical protein
MALIKRRGDADSIKSGGEEIKKDKVKKGYRSI